MDCFPTLYPVRLAKPVSAFSPFVSRCGDRQECYGTLVWNADVTHMPCMQLAISKALGLGIVVFGTIMKVPQMLKILQAGSAQGISLGMYILETLAYTISLAYAYRKEMPFSTYGENASLTVQSMFAFAGHGSP